MSGATIVDAPSVTASLSPTRAALASASEKAAAKPGQVVVGTLCIRACILRVFNSFASDRLTDTKDCRKWLLDDAIMAAFSHTKNLAAPEHAA
ncbi:hypothetical protein JG687_00016293 [Phytophthora cactorum]|uniref:Uncharacterized protein n=1 Tax=Phytophthora cactorum TaxID=29920 RepID=A0A8T1TVL7_9STRA|nr:hypothetical protein JG687_00016293 [Phytophthora cactorum]